MTIIMQYDKQFYNPAEHDQYRALCVKQPYAADLVTLAAVGADELGRGIKSIEVRSRPTKYRGELLICASRTPATADFPNPDEYCDLPKGCTIGFVELYDCKPVMDFTEKDWAATRIPPTRRAQINGGYGWFMRNPRRCIEHPVRGQLGIFTLTYTKDVIMAYPTELPRLIKHLRQQMKTGKIGNYGKA